MSRPIRTREFRIPAASDPREAWWWWEQEYDERELRLQSRKIASERRRWQGIPIPRNVYCLGCDVVDLIKIGSAFDIELRIEQLQAASPVKLRLLSYVRRGGEAMERRLHRMFRTRRAHGEWFRVPLDEINAAIDTIIAEERAARAAQEASPQ